MSAERPAPVALEALETWGDKLVARVAEAARTADTPGDNAAAVHIGRMEEPQPTKKILDTRLRDTPESDASLR